MVAVIRNVTFDCPDAQALASFYAELLMMPIRHLDTSGKVVIGNDKSRARLAFVTVEDYRAPTWPDPAYPQQVHLDGPTVVRTDDAESPTEMALRLGAKRLPHLGGGCPVYADPAGHPFCLCAGPPANEEERALRGLLGGIVFDCFESPRALAEFYAELLDMPLRMEDEEGWVTIRAREPTPRDFAFDLAFDLAFQGAKGKPPRWLDPARPQQVHLDLEVEDLAATDDQVIELGATRLPDLGPDCAVYADPEGHPFCLYMTGSPEKRQLA